MPIARGRLFQRNPPVSDHLLKIHASNGVGFRLGQAVFACVGDDGKVTGVQLANGEIIPADIVLVGIGLEPSVKVMEQAGCRIDNGVVVDADLHTGLDGIYAMGDCAYFPTPFALGGHARIESIPNATAHAHALAARFSGRPAPQTAAPWFWSDQYDVKLKTVGLHTGYDRLVVRGAPESGAFSVAYLKEGRLIALDAVNSPAEFAQAKALVTQKASLDFDRLADPRIKLKETVISLDLPNDTVSQGMDAVRA